ncbi:hypothetical protein D3C85_1672510 [compost metagenome]
MRQGVGQFLHALGGQAEGLAARAGRGLGDDPALTDQRLQGAPQGAFLMQGGLGQVDQARGAEARQGP